MKYTVTHRNPKSSTHYVVKIPFVHHVTWFQVWSGYGGLNTPETDSTVPQVHISCACQLHHRTTTGAPSQIWSETKNPHPSVRVYREMTPLDCTFNLYHFSRLATQIIVWNMLSRRYFKQRGHLYVIPRPPDDSMMTAY